VTEFLDYTIDGVVNGMIYAAFALSLVLIWRATRVLNFALPGMAMITTYISYSLIQHGHSYWLAFVVALLAGLAIGAVVELVLIRPVENGPPLNPVIVTLGLLILLEAVAGMIYGGAQHRLPVPFSTSASTIGHTEVSLSRFDIFLVLAVLALMAVLLVLFRRTAVGLRMRAAAFEPEVARLLGVRVGVVLLLGWALASAAGSLGGLLIPQPAFIYPSYLEPFLVFGFTAAIIGGLDSPGGAVIGSLALGIVLSYVEGYVTNGSDLVSVGALAALVLVLLVRPDGLFSRSTARRI
jgi:branched-chain amino acid transport system permease protein